jgi:hypothetical protein
MAKKTRKKPAAKKTKKKKKSGARKTRKAAVKRKAPARKKKPAAKRKGILGKIVGAATAVVDTLTSAESLHHKMEPHVSPDPE